MKTRDLKPRSRRHRLGNLDQRTFEGKLYTSFRAELTQHCGGDPSIIQKAIIERATWVRVRLGMLDSKVATGDLTMDDSHTYLAWANTLARLLARLGIEPAAAPGPSLSDILADIERQRSPARHGEAA